MNAKARRILPGSTARTRWTSGVLLALVATAALFLQTPAIAGSEAVEGGVRFTHNAPNAVSVSMAGEFNGWSTTETPMTEKDGVWEVVIALDPGTHEYKFVVDGQWMADPDNPVTSGEFGNSAITVTSGGELGAMEATSNTPLSPKVTLGGRAIGFYLYKENPRRGNQLELEKPQLDFDLDFKIRVNQDLDAHVLTNVSNEADAVDFWQTRLNFDRGSLILDNPEIFLHAWDNEAIESWDDPLHLIGNIGIYDHDYGFNTVGAMLRKEYRGFEAEVLYSDDSDAGGTSGPSVEAADLAGSPGVVLNQSGTFIFSTPELYEYSFLDSDNLEDVLAVRLKRPLGAAMGGSWTASGLYRLDRGSRPGGLAFLRAETGGGDPVEAEILEYERTFENWTAFGGDVRFESDGGIIVEAEVLRGKAVIDAFDGNQTHVTLTTTEGDEEPTVDLEFATDSTPVPDEDYDLDESTRFWLGAKSSTGPFGLSWSGSIEFEDHTLAPPATGLLDDIENEMLVWRGKAGKSWDRFPVLGRPVEAEFGFEFFDFSFADDAPWETQPWFDRRNFWLDLGEHKLDYHKLTLLGGNDAFVWHPMISVRVEEEHRIDLVYKGTLGSQGFDRNPKYFESIILLQGFVTQNWRAQLDARIARYDDPTLELSDTFTANFLEIAYLPTKGVSLAFSYGVDPWVIDAPVNKYDYIGRDQYLFGEGANAGNAQTNYLAMGRLIREAEQKLENVKRFQLEAVLHF